MRRLRFGILVLAIQSILPAQAQMLDDIVDHPVLLNEASSTRAGKSQIATVTSLPVFSSFTGLAVELWSNAESLDGRVRMWESTIAGEWIPLHFVRSFTDGFYIAGFHGNRVWSSAEIEIEVTGPVDGAVRFGRSGVFDNRNDEDWKNATEPQEPHELQAPRPPEPERRDGVLDDLIVPPPLITRADWNAGPFVLGSPVPLANPTYDYMTFHHAAGYSATTYEEGIAQVKAIQDLHQNVRGWSDIGYQFLIDRSGRVYQGRPFLDSSTTLAQEPRLALGAHVGGFNTGNIGICMLGCYHPPEGSYCEQSPTPESIDAYVTMFAFLSERYGPEASSIRGHRDWASTACPGDNNYVLLPSIRTDTQTLLITGNQAIASAEMTLSPGAEGTVRITWNFLEDFGVQSYRLERTYNGTTSLLIDGTTAQSGSVTDAGVTGTGTATYELYVTAVDGRTQRVASSDIALDLPDMFQLSQAFPNPATNQSTIRFFMPYEGFVHVELHDAAGRLVRTLKDGFEDGEEWILARVDVSGLASGLYYYRIRVEGFSGTVFDETRGLAILR